MSSAFTLQGIQRDDIKESVKFKEENGPPVRVASWFQGNENGNFKQRVFSIWKLTRKRKSWTLLNFYVYARAFIYRLYFIYARKSQLKFTSVRT